MILKNSYKGAIMEILSFMTMLIMSVLLAVLVFMIIFTSYLIITAITNNEVEVENEKQLKHAEEQLDENK